MKKYSNFAIVVLSCDKYSDLWDPFFSLLKKHWVDCPFTVYLGSNTIKYSDRSIPTVLSGQGVDWSTDLLHILKQLKEEYVFLWVEDFFPIDSVDTKSFYRCIDFMKREKANHIHFSPIIKPDGVCEDTFFGYYETGAPYRSIVEGFWRKSHLQDLLLPGENPWNFEIMGSYRSKYSTGYFTVTKALFNFIRVVEKGKISRDAYSYCSQHNVVLNLEKRPLLTYQEQFVSHILSGLFGVIRYIHWKKRLSLMNILRKILITY